MAGGTGLFPFMDFIDLMFKKQCIREGCPFSQEIIEIDSVLLDKNWCYKVTLLAAFQQPEDIHPLTLEQINFLSKNK